MLKLTGNLEQEVLDVLANNKDPLKPAEVLEKLGRNLAYTTVLTMLQRLYKKGLIDREQRKNAYAYFVKETYKKTTKQNLNKVFDGLLTSYGDLAISQFLETLKKDPKQKDLLDKYLSSLNEK
jgi:predicted transcriptional regulator